MSLHEQYLFIEMNSNNLARLERNISWFILANYGTLPSYRCDQT